MWFWMRDMTYSGRPFKESGKRLGGRGESRHQLGEWGQTLAGKAPGLGLGLECAVAILWVA